MQENQSVRKIKDETTFLFCFFKKKKRALIEERLVLLREREREKGEDDL